MVNESALWTEVARIVEHYSSNEVMLDALLQWASNPTSMSAGYGLEENYPYIAKNLAVRYGISRVEAEQRGQVDRLVESGSLSPRDAALLQLFAECGPRPGEVADPEDHLLRFTDIHGDHLEVSGKRGQRTVPISPELRERLLSLRGERPWDSPLFLNDRGTGPLTTSGVRGAVRRALAAAGITGVRLCPFTLRHSVGTQAAEEGVGLDVVQRTLGHRSLTTTMVYRHLSDTQARAAWRRRKGGADSCAKSAPAAHRGQRFAPSVPLPLRPPSPPGSAGSG